MADALVDAVQGKGRPLLGICVGMQLLATRGLEYGETLGLGWIAGDVVAIRPKDPGLKIPHMGWNTLDRAAAHPLLAGIPTGPQGLHAYFVHSYQLVPADREVVVAETEYGGPVTAIVAQGNIAGTQFHPEKSQTLGLRLLSNFLGGVPDSGCRGLVRMREQDDVAGILARQATLEPAHGRVQRRHLVADVVKDQPVLRLEKRGKLGADLILARRGADVPGVVEGARPGLSQAHDGRRQGVLVLLRSG
jgi:imidazole glycerol phosphate synthase glutamine amidotransferase subunit